MLHMSCELLCHIFQVSQSCLTLLTFETEVKWKLCHLFCHVVSDGLKYITFEFPKYSLHCFLGFYCCFIFFFSLKCPIVMWSFMHKRTLLRNWRLKSICIIMESKQFLSSIQLERWEVHFSLDLVFLTCSWFASRCKQGNAFKKNLEISRLSVLKTPLFNFFNIKKCSITVLHYFGNTSLFYKKMDILIYFLL